MNYNFCGGGGGGGGGGGAEDQKNKNVWRYDEIMIYFFYVLGVISINLGLFKVNVQIWKMFLGSLKFEYVLGMPDIPYICLLLSKQQTFRLTFSEIRSCALQISCLTLPAVIVKNSRLITQYGRLC